MRRLLMILVLAWPVVAEAQIVPPIAVQSRDGANLSGIARAVFETTDRQGVPPAHWLSPRLQADDQDPIRRPGWLWRDDPGVGHLNAWHLNTSPGLDGRPPYATVSVSRQGDRTWGRRLTFIEWRGHWVLDHACRYAANEQPRPADAC